MIDKEASVPKATITIPPSSNSHHTNGGHSNAFHDNAMDVDRVEEEL